MNKYYPPIFREFNFDISPKGEIANENAGPLNLHPSNLVDFGGKGKYRAPEFIWF
jgi:hypothetical protein